MTSHINSHTFEKPLGVVNSDGDVVIPGGEPSPQPQDWARADLERDHPMTAPVLPEIPTDESQLAESTAALQHRLSKDTRIRGLGHVASIREDMDTRRKQNGGEPRYPGRGLGW